MNHLYKIHDKLYDLTNFVKYHPGGEDIFNNLKTKTNITSMIYAYHKDPRIIFGVLSKYEVPFKDDIIIQYDEIYTYDSYCELKKLVHDEMNEKNIPLHWSNQEIAYNIFLFSVYLSIWFYCLCNKDNLSSWWMVLLAIYSLGFWGLIFHESCHFAPFKNQRLNRFLSKTYPFANSDYWSYNHNYLHHSFTNTENDFDTFTNPQNAFRLLDVVKLKYYHKYQFTFPLAFFISGIISKRHLYFSMRQSKIFITLLILYYFGLVKTIVFFGTLGLNFGFISQLSHIHYECIKINTANKKDFLYNQISSSMNYKTYDPITNFCCLGLDIQIEHHLFPNIPNSSLRRIQHIVRNYCSKNDIPYIEKSNVFQAIYSYISYLHKMGNP
jgi:linoleoyl-CoA desaturase